MNAKKSNKTIACIIARTVSTRLPLKVLRTVHDSVSMLDFIIQRTKLASLVDEVVLCTSEEAVDDILEDVAKKNNVDIYRGNVKEIARMVGIGEQRDAEILIRITGDNVFIAYEYLNDQIELLIKNDLDYVRLVDLPFGSSAEVIRRTALEDCFQAMDPSIDEYLTLFIFDPDKFNCGVVKVEKSKYSHLTVTVDTPADLTRTKEILASISVKEKAQIKTTDIIKIIDKKNIPNSIYQPTGLVKMPFNETITFKDFSDDMRERVSKSRFFDLSN